MHYPGLCPYGSTAAFTEVWGSWIVPVVQQAFGACTGGWDYSSHWVGIDGNTNGLLVQAGSEADAYCKNGSKSTVYRPWVEWLPNAEIILKSNGTSGNTLPFAPGDLLYVVVTATNWSNGQSKNGKLYFVDYTQQWSISISFTAASLGGSHVVGASAEFIV